MGSVVPLRQMAVGARGTIVKIRARRARRRANGPGKHPVRNSKELVNSMGSVVPLRQMAVGARGTIVKVRAW